MSGELLVNNLSIPEGLDCNSGVPWHVLHPRKNLITESNWFRKGYCPGSGGIPRAMEFRNTANFQNYFRVYKSADA